MRRQFFNTLFTEHVLRVTVSGIAVSAKSLQARVCVWVYVSVCVCGYM